MSSEKGLRPKRSLPSLSLERVMGYIPARCYFSHFSPLYNMIPDEVYKLCQVEANGKILCSCVTEVKEGVSIKTRTPNLLELQKRRLKLMLRRYVLDFLISYIFEDASQPGNYDELKRVVEHIGFKEFYRIYQETSLSRIIPSLREITIFACFAAGMCRYVRIEQLYPLSRILIHSRRTVQQELRRCRLRLLISNILLSY